MKSCSSFSRVSILQVPRLCCWLPSYRGDTVLDRYKSCEADSRCLDGSVWAFDHPAAAGSSRAVGHHSRPCCDLHSLLLPPPALLPFMSFSCATRSVWWPGPLPRRPAAPRHPATQCLAGSPPASRGGSSRSLTPSSTSGPSMSCRNRAPWMVPQSDPPPTPPPRCRRPSSTTTTTPNHPHSSPQ